MSALDLNLSWHERILWNHVGVARPHANVNCLLQAPKGLFLGYWDEVRGEWVQDQTGETVRGVTHHAIPRGPGIRPAEAFAAEIAPPWRIEYGRESVEERGAVVVAEWWTVTNGKKSFACTNASDASFLVELLERAITG